MHLLVDWIRGLTWREVVAPFEMLRSVYVETNDRLGLVAGGLSVVDWEVGASGDVLSVDTQVTSVRKGLAM